MIEKTEENKKSQTLYHHKFPAIAINQKGFIRINLGSTANDQWLKKKEENKKSQTLYHHKFPAIAINQMGGNIKAKTRIKTF